MVNSLGNIKVIPTSYATRLAAVVALGVVLARLNAPSSGQSCSVRHATMQDADGRTMWCDRAMIGHHSLVWQYNWV